MEHPLYRHFQGRGPDTNYLCFYGRVALAIFVNRVELR